uniref:Uncharacterized protein n=1 Tax=Arundo donax TaxID=35708 RepID=A0A0A9AMR3_ARUDO
MRSRAHGGGEEVGMGGGAAGAGAGGGGRAGAGACGGPGGGQLRAGQGLAQDLRIGPTCAVSTEQPGIVPVWCLSARVSLLRLPLQTSVFCFFPRTAFPLCGCC